MQVRDVMSTPVDLIDPSTSLSQAAHIMRDDDVGAIPIGENDRLVGMLTDRDIVIRGLAEDKEAKTTQVRDVMSSGVLYCFDDQPVEEAATLMSEQQVRRLAVVNRDKRLVGIVSLGDVWTKGSSDIAADTLHDVAQSS